MIDVSDNNGVIEWEKVRTSGQKRAYIKASEGVSVVDSQFGRNVKKARESGIQVGVYHYAHPSNPPHREAAHFLAVAGPHLHAGDLRPALDLEVTEGHSWEYVNEWKAQWFAVVDDHIGALAVFYSYWYFWKHMRLHKERPVWGAYVGKSPPEWAEWAMWQWSFTGRVDGIGGVVDLDRWRTLPTISKAV